MKTTTERLVPTNSIYGYRGVRWCAIKGKYRAYITLPSKEPGGHTRTKNLGRFSTVEAAARRYDEAAREKYGSAAALNFPKPGENAAVAHTYNGVTCRLGHLFSEQGYWSEFHDRYFCRECNRQAMRRYKARKVADLAAP
jgi:hypothetical protein